jgi:dCMP deaminase
MRPSIDETMINIALVLAKRGTCLKRKVGCVIIDSYGNILSTGYNGAPRGMQHCDEYSPCLAYVKPELSCSALHAEVNAIARCPDIDKINTVYVTEACCEKCLMAIQNTSAKRVVWLSENKITEAGIK